jgi:hypothetical protein
MIRVVQCGAGMHQRSPEVDQHRVAAKVLKPNVFALEQHKGKRWGLSGN